MARCTQNGRSNTVAFLSECFSFITRKSLRVIESGRVGGGGGGEGVRSSIPRFIERNIKGREAIPHLIPGVATKPD